jgi:tRNA threonylcarbamoyladenosine biosynthesis protein TsaB
VTARLLALDAAADACSVALQFDGRSYERAAGPARAQAADLLPLVDAVLADAHAALRDLDALVVGRGPGAFTGVRLAIGVAQGLALGAGLSVVPVSDLAMLAQTAAARHACARFVVCMDARMDEVYWAAYERTPSGVVAPLSDERLAAPADVVPPFAGPFVGVGAGWTRHAGLRAAFAGALAACEDEPPHARAALVLAAPLLAAGAALDPRRVVPVYLRDRVAARPRG